MRLFLYEYLSAGGAADSSLRAEGRAMLSALVEDFSRILGVEVLTLLDESIAEDIGHDCRRTRAEIEPVAFRQRAREAEATIIIAPEFDDLLASRSEWAREEGSILLGSSPEAIRAASDKANLERVLHANGVRTPRLVHPDSSDMSLSMIRKPRFGAGCMEVRFLDPRCRWTPDPAMIVQEAVPGVAVSAAVLVREGGCVPLRAGYQDVRCVGGMLSYHGGGLPLPAPLEQRALTLAIEAIQCFSTSTAELNGVIGPQLVYPSHQRGRLNGFIGVDLVLGDADDGSADFVIEINPRVTTAYVGLRRLCVDNLAEAWLQMMLGETVTLRWHPASLTFTADGKIKVERHV